MQNPVIRPVTDPHDPAMPALRRIYESQLPASERKPTAWLDEVVQRADYQVMIADDQATAVGFAIVFTPADSSDAALLEYLAIAESYQGRGVGSMLVRAITTPRPLLAEVEAGDEPDAIRRREFYHRLGFRRLRGLRYLLPLPNAPAMELMLRNSPEQLSRETLIRWLTTIYQSVYLCGPHDSRLMSMLTEYTQTI